MRAIRLLPIAAAAALPLLVAACADEPNPVIVNNPPATYAAPPAVVTAPPAVVTAPPAGSTVVVPQRGDNVIIRRD